MEKKFRILLVQSDKTNGLVFKAMLKQVDEIEIVHVEWPEEALPAIEKEKIDLVVSDLRGKADLGGLELAEKVRSHANKNISKIPLIAWTAYNLPIDYQKATEAGFNVFLTMPDTEQRHMLEAIKVFIPINVVHA